MNISPHHKHGFIFTSLALKRETCMTMESETSTSRFLLCLKISSERWEKEKEESIPLLKKEEERKKKTAVWIVDEERISKKKKVEESSLPPPLVEEEEEELKEAKKKEEKMRKRSENREINIQPLSFPLLDLNEEPNPLWEEMNVVGKPTFIFRRSLTDSDVRPNLLRCILNRTEMERVLKPALTKEEDCQVHDKDRKLPVIVLDERLKQRYEMKLVWWPRLKQYALVNGWIEFATERELREGDAIQVFYFRFGDKRQLGLLINCRPEL